MHVHLNCAVDRDLRMAGPGGEPVRISSEADMRRVHRLRAEVDCILVGVGTVLRDDPSLRVKPEYATGPDPVPVVMDRHARTPASARVNRPGARIYYEDGTPEGDATFIRLDEVAPHTVEKDLGAAGYGTLLVEGGPTVLRAFIEAGQWEVFTMFQADIDLGDGPALWKGLFQGGFFDHVRREPMDGGALWSYSH